VVPVDGDLVPRALRRLDRYDTDRHRFHEVVIERPGQQLVPRGGSVRRGAGSRARLVMNSTTLALVFHFVLFASMVSVTPGTSRACTARDGKH
jgi:hypothetical protein